MDGSYFKLSSLNHSLMYKIAELTIELARGKLIRLNKLRHWPCIFRISLWHRWIFVFVQGWKYWIGMSLIDRRGKNLTAMNDAHTKTATAIEREKWYTGWGNSSWYWGWKRSVPLPFASFEIWVWGKDSWYVRHEVLQEHTCQLRMSLCHH